MSYEHAPQTHVLATHCLICGKALCDSASVEAGMGPTCRKRTGYVSTCTDENRAAANKLIHTVSCSKGTDERIGALNELLAMGFSGVVKAMLRSVADVKVAMTDANHPHGEGRYAVKTPYRPEVVLAMQAIPGRRWDKMSKVNTFPAISRLPLFQMLCEEFVGSIGVGPKGIFKLAMPDLTAKEQAA